MKKVCVWLGIISAIVLLITLGVVGVKLLDGNYDTTAEVIITGISFPKISSILLIVYHLTFIQYNQMHS